MCCFCRSLHPENRSLAWRFGLSPNSSTIGLRSMRTPRAVSRASCSSSGSNSNWVKKMVAPQSGSSWRHGPNAHGLRGRRVRRRSPLAVATGAVQHMDQHQNAATSEMIAKMLNQPRRGQPHHGQTSRAGLCAFGKRPWRLAGAMKEAEALLRRLGGVTLKEIATNFEAKLTARSAAACSCAS